MSYQCYEKKRRDSIGDDNISSIKDNNSMKEIEKYNEIDCKSMWDILKYLRANH